MPRSRNGRAAGGDHKRARACKAAASKKDQALARERARLQAVAEQYDAVEKRAHSAEDQLLRLRSSLEALLDRRPDLDHLVGRLLLREAAAPPFEGRSEDALQRIAAILWRKADPASGHTRAERVVALRKLADVVEALDAWTGAAVA